MTQLYLLLDYLHATSLHCNKVHEDEADLTDQGIALNLKTKILNFIFPERKARQMICLISS